MKIINRKKIIAALRLIVADFKTVEVKFIEQGADAEDVKKYLKEFKTLRDEQKIKDPDEKNIDHWGKQAFDKLVDFVDSLKGLSTEIRRLKQKKIKGAELVAENNDWYVFSINSLEASKFLAEDTEWCIRYENHWKSYYESSDFYFYISKNRTDKWKKIALQLSKDGKKYWDITDKSHSSLPSDLNVPIFDPVFVPRLKINGNSIRIDLLEELPDNIKISDLFRVSDYKKLKKLPNQLVVGILDLSHSDITELPSKLKADTLLLGNSKITEIPDDISVKNLSLRDSLDVKLPQSLKLKMLLLENSAIKKLPDNLTVDNILTLKDTLIDEIPKNLHVDVLRINEKIKKIPANICANKIDLMGFDVELPENLSVGSLRGIENLTKLPKSLRILDADLDLTKSKVTELPDNLIVTGTLKLPKGLKKLPKNMKIAALDVKGSEIEELPPDLKTGYLDISNTKIKKLPDNNVYDHKLLIKNTPIKELPAGLECLVLDMRKTEIEELPADAIITTLYLNDKISTLPESLISSRIYVAENQLKQIPDHLADAIIETYA